MKWFDTSDRSENVAQASLLPKPGQAVVRYRIWAAQENWAER